MTHSSDVDAVFEALPMPRRSDLVTGTVLLVHLKSSVVAGLVIQIALEKITVLWIDHGVWNYARGEVPKFGGSLRLLAKGGTK